MTYSHTQRAPMYLIVIAAAVLFLALALLLPVPLPARIAIFAGAVLVLFLAYCFKTLTVQGEDAHLVVRFGPLPVFGKRIPYGGMTGATRVRSTLLDGWGIHYTSGRGWIYNLWGFDCVEIRLESKTLRVGTDDPDGLAQFLNAKVLSKQ